jgi:hypothetical protein
MDAPLFHRLVIRQHQSDAVSHQKLALDATMWHGGAEQPLTTGPVA